MTLLQEPTTHTAPTLRLAPKRSSRSPVGDAHLYILHQPATSASIQGAMDQLGEIHSAAFWGDLSLELVRSDGRKRLLICDTELPGISGLDLCRLVRAHAPGVKLVLFTLSPELVPAGVADAVVPTRLGVGALRAKVFELLRS